MKFYVKILAMIILLAGIYPCFINAYAQEDVGNKFRIQTKAVIGKELSNKWSASLSPEIRFSDYMEIDEILTEAGITYGMSPYLEFSGRYQVGLKNIMQGSAFVNRYALDALIKIPVSELVPEFRVRVSDYADFNEENNESRLRYRAFLCYLPCKSRVSVWAGPELYQATDLKTCEKLRYEFGMEYNLGKNEAIGISYMMDDYFKNIKHNHIMNVSYKIKF